MFVPSGHGRCARQIFFQGAELGSTRALYGVANAYNSSEGVEKDGKKARHYYELAAMKGDNISRCNLGAEEGIAGDFDKALKHLLISCGRGRMFSLKNIKLLFMKGAAAKEDYEKALQSYQQYIDEIKSDQRDKAAASIEDFIYLPLKGSEN